MEIKALDAETQDLLRCSLKYPSLDAILIELVKNSIAGLSDYIEIILKNEGICIKDNGIGIAYEILSSLVQNKLAGGLSDLKVLSAVCLITNHSQNCWKTDLKTILPSKSLQKPGTVICLTKTYSKIPARAVALNRQTILSIVSNLEALIILNPNISFKVYYDNELVASYGLESSLKNRIYSLCGVSNLHHVCYVGDCIELEGYISHLNQCLLHNNYQYFYINYIPAILPDISNRINCLYSDAIKLINPDTKPATESKKPKFPVFALCLTVRNPGENAADNLQNMFSVLKEITIMIKEQIFNDPLLSVVCDKYLSQISIKTQRSQWNSPKTYTFVPDIDDLQLAKSLETLPNTIATQKKSKNKILLDFPYKNFDTPTVQHSIQGLMPKNLEKLLNSGVFSDTNTLKTFSCDTSLIVNKLNIIKIIGQVNQKFIIGIINTNQLDILTAFDQHASHERIRLESLEKTLHTDLSSENCKILLKLTAFDMSELMKNKNNLEKYNFVTRQEDQRLFLVKLPKLYDIKFTFSDFILAIHSKTTIPTPILSCLKYRACRSSVKFGDILSLSQCEDICKSLQTCVLFDKCAHGRPTFYPLISFPKEKRLPKPVYSILKVK
jgi:DNA mismatch repair ATPase MutL